MTTIAKSISALLVSALLCMTSVLAEKGPSAGKNSFEPDPSNPATSLIPQYGAVKQGFTMKIELMNVGSMGRVAYPPFRESPSPPRAESLGLEYPIGDRIEHLYGGGVWIGGLLDTAKYPATSPPLKLASVAYEGWAGPYYEFRPGSDPANDRFWRASRFDSVTPPGWEQYWGGSLPFHPLSDQDFYCTYRDSHSVSVQNHIPMNLKVIQSSYAWNDPYADAIIIIEYKIINMGSKPIDSSYVGFFFEPDVGPISVPLYYQHNFSGYYSNARLAYVHNPIDRGSTPVGVTLLSTARSLDSLRYAFRYFNGPLTPATDPLRYDFMSSGIVDSSDYPRLSDARFIFAFGPFKIKPSNPIPPTPGVRPDTLKIAVAVVSGSSRTIDPRIIMQRNARRALDIYLNQGIKLPATPPSPPLRVKVGFRRVELDWKWRTGDNILLPGGDPRINGRPDPERNWDKTNIYARRDPCRITNPPPGSPADSGGRNFEAYRLWRSENPDYPEASFTLLKQFDVGAHDSTIACQDTFFYNTGLQYSFVDSNLVRGKTYVYAVTSVSIPNLANVELPGGIVIQVPVEELESSKRVATDNAAISGNATRVDLPFAVSADLGKVSVVPNPYRTDRDYKLESGGYEGNSSAWNENLRVVKFINLPPKCTIRIFSLSGDLIKTVEHDGTMEAYPRGDHNVTLLSESNRAMASGIYIFTVESGFGIQTGKFVIIR
jgi:hypothetical protein